MTKRYKLMKFHVPVTPDLRKDSRTTSGTTSFKASQFVARQGFTFISISHTFKVNVTHSIN